MRFRWWSWWCNESKKWTFGTVGRYSSFWVIPWYQSLHANYVEVPIFYEAQPCSYSTIIDMENSDIHASFYRAYLWGSNLIISFFSIFGSWLELCIVFLISTLCTFQLYYGHLGCTPTLSLWGWFCMPNLTARLLHPTSAYFIDSMEKINPNHQLTQITKC